jgi:chaperonin GroES
MTTQTAKKSTLRPLGNRVLVKRLAAEERIKGGLLLPESAQKKQEIAEVIAIGSGKTLDGGHVIPVPVQIGQRILMDKYAGQEVTLDDEEYVIVRADDIIAIVN